MNILKDHCSPLTSGTNLRSIKGPAINGFTFQDTVEGDSDMVGGTVLVSTVFNITQSSKQT